MPQALARELSSCGKLNDSSEVGWSAIDAREEPIGDAVSKAKRRIGEGIQSEKVRNAAWLESLGVKAVGEVDHQGLFFQVVRSRQIPQNNILSVICVGFL